MLAWTKVAPLNSAEGQRTLILTGLRACTEFCAGTTEQPRAPNDVEDKLVNNSRENRIRPTHFMLAPYGTSRPIEECSGFEELRDTRCAWASGRDDGPFKGSYNVQQLWNITTGSSHPPLFNLVIAE